MYRPRELVRAVARLPTLPTHSLWWWDMLRFANGLMMPDRSIRKEMLHGSCQSARGGRNCWACMLKPRNLLRNAYSAYSEQGQQTFVDK